MENSKLFADIKLVTVKPLHIALQKNKYVFSLPDVKDKITAIPRHIDFKSEKNHTIFAKVEPEGDLIFDYKDGIYAVYCTVGKDIYEIYHVEKDVYAFGKQTRDITTGKEFCGGSIKKEDAPAPKNSTKNRREAAILDQNCSTNDKFRILVLYTNNAQNTVPNLTGLAQTCVNQFNAATSNSGIGNVQAELVGPFLLPDFSEVSNAQTDVNNLASNLTAQSLRDLYKGDCVVLFTDKNYTGGYTSFPKSHNVNIDEAYGVVRAQYATYANNFVHIVSHVFGTQHQRCNLDPQLCEDGHPFAHAWRFNTGWWNVTTNTTIAASVQWNPILNFSNPNVGYNGQATGTNENNNARQISEQYNTVRAFRYGPSTLAVSLYGNYSTTTYYQIPGRYYTVNANPRCGVPPYQYNWQVSSNGYSFTTVSNATSFSTYLSAGEYKVVRLQIISADGQIEYASVTLIGNCNGCRTASESSLNPQSGNIDNEANTEIIAVQPNPVTDVMEVSVSLKEESSVDIEITDLTGRSISVVKNKILPSGQHTIRYDCGKLPSGVYLCKTQIGNDAPKTIKVIVNR